MGVMNSVCEQCGGPTNLLREGARFCSVRCRVAAHRARKKADERFPLVMRQSRRWVRHTGEKRPITVTGRPLSVVNPSMWSTYEQARDSDSGVGLGWVLGEGIGCVDLDDCFTADGRLESWAQEELDRWRDEAVLVEVSRSGWGLHIFAPMGPGKGRRIRDGRNIEVYPPDSGRYIAVTGDRLE